jgi:hypothetical protein
MVHNLNNSEKDIVQISNISEDEWEKYRALWTISQELDRMEVGNDFVQVYLIKLSEMNDTVTLMKNRKARGHDGLHLELFKCASCNVKMKLLNILNIGWMTHTIPNDWWKAVVIPIFKKGNRNVCKNYRGTCLLNSGI